VRFRFIASFLMMFGMHTTAQSQIEIFGLSWGLEDIKSEVKSMGYSCRASEIFPKDQFCINGEKQIDIIDGTLKFNCHVWNGCGFGLREVAQEIINAGIIDNLEYDVKIGSGGFSGGNFESYCGRGRDGDKLCISFNSLIGLGITLYKGNFGNGGMSFN